MSEQGRWHTPPLWQAIAAAVASVAAFVYLRVYFYASAVVPLTYALPLLLTLWHRNRMVHYGLLIGFTALAVLKVFFVAPADPDISRAATFGMMLMNIWTVGLVVDWLVIVQARLWNTNEELTLANTELEASNEELAAREEEISNQNEELQRQAEELEQQMEELQEQTEEVQQQSEELMELQALAAAREQVLQSLFNISTGLGTNGDADQAYRRICQATVQAFGDSATAAVLLEPVGDELVVRGCYGLDSQHLKPGCSFHDPFARAVVERSRTACVEDLQATEEIYTPTAAGKEVCAVLAAPLFVRQAVCGVIVVYSAEKREWMQADFQTTEWLASQGALLLQAMNLQQELDRRSREAENASHRKTQFLAAVSHDLRTPANAINLMAEVLEQTKANPEMANDIPDLVGRLRDNTKQLVELVSDVLDISRLDCGRIELDRSDFDFGKLIEGEVQQYQAVAEAAGLSLQCDLPQQPVWIHTDRMKVIRVVENLINNAIKFTERGSVVAQVATTDDGLELCISDTGVGIPHDDLDHIFDEFFQVRNPERDRSKGTGLGLAICRRLIDALGFSLTVRSHVGQGTTFTIRIPAQVLVDPPASPPLDSDAAAADGERRLAGRRVLLVEDHEATRLAVARLLTLHGATVEQVAEARQAIGALRRSDVDILLLDLMLPDMDGREVLRYLQPNRPARLRCVLAVSGDVTEQRRKEVLALGADGIQTKPIELSSLVDRINDVLQRSCAASPAS